MPKKKQEHEILEEFEKRNLKVVDIKNYKNKDTKLNCIDTYNYKYYLSYSDVGDYRTVSFDIVAKHNPYSIENIKNFIKVNDGDCVLISEKYTSPREKIKLKCSCGNEYDILWYHLKQHKKFICNKCSVKIRASNNLKSYDYSKNICDKFGYKLISTDTLRNIVFEDKEGYKYKSTIYSVQSRGYNKDRFAKDNPFTVYNMCNYIKKNNFDIKLVDETERMVEIRLDYLQFYCCDCGCVYDAMWGQVAYNNRHSMLRHRCSRCSKRESNLEYEVRSYLDSLDIKYTKQKRFANCKNVGVLPFDFYLDDYCIAIEVQGDQHFYKNDMFSQTLEERKRIDKIKKDYCINNNIKYLAIPSWDIVKQNKKYKKTIDNILNQK